MRKVIILISVVLISIFIISCSTNTKTIYIEKVETSSEVFTTTDFVETVTNETSTKQIETTTKSIETTTENKKGMTKHKVGSFVNLYFDESYCEVKCTVTKVRSRYYEQEELVNISVYMKNGYYFSGLYKDNYNSENLIASYESSLISANKEINVYIDYSMKVLYFVNENEYLTGFYSVANKTNIGMIDPEIYSQSGYELVGYKVGNKIYNFSDSFPTDKPTINVDCVWEKVTPSNEGSTLKTS